MGRTYAPGCYMPPLDNRLYTCIAELTPGQRRWFTHHDAVRSRLKRYQENIDMRSKIEDAAGVVMAGPDEPGLIAAEVREGNTARLSADGDRLLVGASVGHVDGRQGGILPMGRVSVSNEMVMRAQQEGMKHENPLGASCVRAMLEAALRG